MLTLYLIIGAFAGIASGLFGIGGGVVVIPALSKMFSHNPDIPTSHTMQMAVGTSLAIMIFTALSALHAHHKREAVRWPLVRDMLPGLMVGAVIGAVIAHFLPSTALQIIFGVFLVFVSVRLIRNKKTKTTLHEKKLSRRMIRLSSLAIGALSSLLGVGGGTLLVPFLLRCELDMREATGTSVACGLAVGMVATISFMVTGLYSIEPVPWSTGYIYWPAFMGVVIASVILAPVGAILAHRLPKELLKQGFGWFLLLIACDMLFFK